MMEKQRCEELALRNNYHVEVFNVKDKFYFWVVEIPQCQQEIDYSDLLNIHDIVNNCIINHICSIRDSNIPIPFNEHLYSFFPLPAMIRLKEDQLLF